MVKSSSSSENKPCCSKACKKNTESLNNKITDLDDKLCNAKNMIYHYKLDLAQVEARIAEHRNQEVKYCEKIRVLEFKFESRANCIESLTKELELIKREKEGLESKLTGFQSASKDLDSLLESQRFDKNKEGLGYSAVPPPAQVYSPPKKDLSWTGLLENPSVTETEASPSTISPKPFIKFVKATDRSTECKTDKVETAKKPAVKYAELYRKTSKKSTVRGNQRNWNNLKSQQLDPIINSFIKWYQNLVRSFDQEKNNIQAQQKKKMVKSSSTLENKPCCSKACKKNTESLNNKITDLDDKLCNAKNMIYHYKLDLAQVEARIAEHRNQEVKYCEKIRVLEFKFESRADCIESLTKELELIKREKEGLESKLTGFQSASKDLDSLLDSQRLDKNKEGLGYSAVPPPAQVYSPPKKDLSWTGLPELLMIL
nr:hypothetical protein [Tanacetum cinerariifolium]